MRPVPLNAPRGQGPLSRAIRELQQQQSGVALGVAPGAAVDQTTRGTFVRPAAGAGGSRTPVVPSQVPRYG